MIAMTIILVVIAGVVTTKSMSRNTSTITAAELNLRLEWVEDCMTAERATSKLTGKDWGFGPGGRALCAADTYGNPRSIEEVDLMIRTVIDASKKNEMIRSACHDILHQVGVSAWLVGEKKSLIKGYSLCGMGYYHGLMSEALVGKDDRERNIAELVKFCSTMSLDTTGKIDWGMNAQCSHGIGHAIGGVIAEMNIGEALCENVIVHRAAEDKKLCFTGALNQYILLHPAETNEPSKEVKTCKEFAGDNLRDCYTFTLFYLKAKAPEVQSFCMTLPEGIERIGCWRGVGMIVSHEELFAGEGTPGYKLAQQPTSFAQYIEEICSGDSTTQCISQLIAEAAEKVLNPELMMKTCDEFVQNQAKNDCIRIISTMRNIHDLNNA